MAGPVIHISEEDAARDFAGLLARVREGAEVVVESDACAVAVLRPIAPRLMPIERRQSFVEELFQAVAVHPLTLEVARLAGRIHGEQMDRGISIDFPDLIIGATALHLSFQVVTVNATSRPSPACPSSSSG